MAQAHATPHKATTKGTKSTKTPTAAPRWVHGKVYWNELMTHNVDSAKAFYRTTLGWNFEPMPMDDGTYWIIKAHDEMVGGIFEMKDPAMKSMPEQWVTYIAVDDIDARLAKAVAAGARVMKEPFEIKSVGRTAFLKEPGGAMICWITPSA